MFAHRSHPLILVFVLAGLVFATAYAVLIVPTAVAAPLAQTSNTCFVEATGDNTTDYQSANASALQTAVNAASPGATLKIAGTCTGVQTVSGKTQTVYINKNLTLRGGYANGSWNAAPNPVANPTILNANNGGRVVYITNNANVTLSYLTLRNGNAGTNFGGGIYADANTNLTLEYGRVENSQASIGGGMITNLASTVIIDHSTLTGNTAESGGAIYANNALEIAITHSSLVSNTADFSAGALYNDNTMIAIEHSTFSNNQVSGGSGDGGGAIVSLGNNSAPTTIRYSTFSNNGSASSGGALRVDDNVTLFATIVANSASGGDCSFFGSSPIDAGYNIIEDGSCLSASTSQSGDPALSSLANNGGFGLTHATDSNSIARNAIPYGVGGCGTTDLTDQRGESRLLSLPCDIGAYEATEDAACFVEATGDNTTDYGSASAYALQTAVTNAAPGTTLKIAGTCAGVEVTGGLTQTVYIDKNLTLQGGYANTNWATSDPDTYPTTLDAQDNGRVVYIPNNNYNVTLDGLTIQNGATTGDGGGVWTGDTLTVTNSAIRDNFAGDDGGGIYFGSGSVGYVAHTTIASNTVNTTSGAYFGGGLYSQLSTITIADSAIYSNTGRGGGGIATIRDDMTISNSAIYGNRGTVQSGGINNQEGAVTLINSTLTQNSSPNGAGIFSFSSNASLTTTLVLSHTTVANNSGNHGIRTVDNVGGATVKTIIYSAVIANNGNRTECNTIGSAAQVDATNGYNIDSDGSCVTDGVDNNITADPLLLPLADNGGNTPTHALSPASPARNAIPFGFNGCGLNNDADQRGVARSQESGCDSGAFEYEGSAPSAVSESYSLTEDVPLTLANPGVLSNATNADGDTLYASLSSDPSNGTLNLSNLGGFTYTPTLNFNGSDSFAYAIADGALPVVGHWAFNEGSGTVAYDASGNAVNGTLVDNATYSATLPGGLAFANAYALDLDGSGDRVNIPASTRINSTAANQRTVSAWFRADDVGINTRKQVIWEEGGQATGLNIYLYAGSLYAGAWASPSSWGGGNWLSTSAISSGQWHHVALVLNSNSTTGAVPNSMFLYLDGALVQSGPAARLAGHAADNGIGDVYVDTRFHNSGTFSGNGGHGFAGQIDEVRVMNLAATADEVQTLMVAWPGLSGGTAVATLNVAAVNDPPIATDNSYTLNEGTMQSGNVISDDTGNGTDSDVETASPSVTVGSDVANGTLSLAANGAFTYLPDWDFTGSDSFTYILSDGVLTDTATVTLTVTDLPDTCFVSVNNSGIIDYYGAGVAPLQTAVTEATPGDTLKIAGTCLGVRSVAGQNQTVYIDKEITLVGGYANGNWNATPDPVANPTTLDADNGGRVVRVNTSSAVTLENLIVQNGRQDWGGGIRNDNATLTLRHTLVLSNTTPTWDGGGLYNQSGIVTVTQTTFSYNQARYGGGIRNHGQMNLSDSTISYNTAREDGAGIANYGILTVTRSTIAYNTANDDGGGLDNYDGQATLINSTISHNQALGNNHNVGGGGVYQTQEGGTPEIHFIHTTIVSNTANNGGNGLHLLGGSVTFTNTLIANGAQNCGAESGSYVSGGYNLEDGDACNLTATGDIVNANPLLGPLADNGGETLTHAILPGSLAFDAIPTHSCAAGEDQRGVTRLQGAGCDIGAYEAEIPALCFVSVNNSSWTDYASLDATALQDAINAANPGDLLKVAGTCAGVQNINGSNQTIYLNKNVTVQGGYTTANWLVSDPVANLTMLDAANGGRVVTIPANQTVTLDGLTLTNGNGDSSSGGAVHIGSSTAVTMTDSVVKNNTGRLGGGIYHGGSSLLLDGVSLQNNTATQNAPNGGGVYNNGGLLTVRNSQLQENAGNWGGGLQNNGTAVVENSTFISNTATYRGGGISNGSMLTITNSTFSGNTGNSFGGAIDNSTTSSVATLTHSTLFGNNAGSGGGLYNEGGTFNLNGTIVAGSVSDKDCFSSGGTISATYSLLESTTNNCGLTDGVDGNIIGLAPQLGDLADNSGATPTVALLWNSPAIDVIPAGVCAVSTDQRGIARPQNSLCDMGAYEYVPGGAIITVTLQGRAGNNAITHTVSLYAVGNPDTAVYSTTATADSSGNFSLNGLPTGTYTMTVQAPGYLQAVELVTIVAETSTAVSFGELRAGDANGDNAVNILDLSILAGAYNTSDGDGSFNSAADFNGDGQVNILDLSLLAGNYNTVGETP